MPPFLKSKKGWVTGMIGVLVVVLDQWSRFSSLIEIYHFLLRHAPPWRIISPFLGPLIFIVGLGFFWLDYQKQKRPKPYDLSTLKGRTLKLRDDMKAYLDNISSATDEPSGYKMTGQIEWATGSSCPVMRLHHGYDLHFADMVKTIFNEFGERNVRDHGLLEALSQTRQVNNEALYRNVIQRLTDLAEIEEAAS